jgi:hypothetical protein
MMQVKIVGLDRLLRKLSPELLVRPMHDFFARSDLAVQAEARRKVPVDEGHLRNMIQTEEDSAQPPRWGKTGFLNAAPGTPLWFKARAMEFGTGRVGDMDVSHQPGHSPPGDALDGWARRHGFDSGWQVAAIIRRRGGLLPRRFLRDGLEAALPKIKGYVERLGQDIAAAWERGI